MKKYKKIFIISLILVLIVLSMSGIIYVRYVHLSGRASLISELPVPFSAKVVKHDEFWAFSNGYFYLELQLENIQFDKALKAAKLNKEYLRGDKLKDLDWYLQGKYEPPKDLTKIYCWYEKAKSDDPLVYTIVLVDEVNKKLVVFVSDS